MLPDVWTLYRRMLFSRRFEEAVHRLWDAGLISAEMHLSMGEEGIVAGVLDHLQPGDALALDHRGTAPLLMHGIDPERLLRECLGQEDGLCNGWGGHMHLFSREHLAASSGIVGASGPAAVGFALAAQHLRPGHLAVAFFGEGAVNQGMLMESFNLAVAWKLPVVFVCKDNGWAIYTPRERAISTPLIDRAAGFGLHTTSVDGRDVTAVWEAARDAQTRAREGRGPSFLHARCVHLEGHLLGDPLVRAVRQPLREIAPVFGPMLRAVTRRQGAPVRQRLGPLREVGTRGNRLVSSQRASDDDPLVWTRKQLTGESDRLSTLEAEVTAQVNDIVARVQPE
ncbi:MAG: thiamine pyrophosphate-dependent dehydrogenase E1 component subunit alpha [Chloroflexi bacterium]|nr:thiamine pyrophosphate-dependent dehydrogenase E1 component subunit alpha [Chloroflexota bacterium]